MRRERMRADDHELDARGTEAREHVAKALVELGVVTHAVGSRAQACRRAHRTAAAFPSKPTRRA